MASSCGVPNALGDLAAVLRRPGGDAVALITDGLAREERGVESVRSARADIQRGINLARTRDGSSWWAIAVSLVPGGAGREPGQVHRGRLELAKRLRQRSRT